MTTNAKLATFFAACSLVLCAAPALAASASTERFVANVRPNVEFLEGSNRLAAIGSASPKLRAFAHSEAGEQAAADALATWTHARAGQLAALDGDALMTGRSVAIDGVIPIVAARTPAPGTLLPSGDALMKHLAALRGHRFDALYRSAQKDVLERLAALYSDYIANGDDAGLRDLASRELANVKERLARLRAL